MELDLRNRVVLVVGGFGLIGSAVAAQLREEGAVVVAASRSGGGDGADGVVLDASDDSSVTAAIDGILREHGRIDGLVVTAAPSARALDPARSSDPEQVLAAIDGKAMTFLRTANAVMPAMASAGYGRIVGISGQNAFTTGNLAGSVRNAALIVAAKNLADAVAGTGVTVNAVSPGVVSETPSATVERGRSGQCRPADVASVVTFLLSPNAGAVSGESIAVGHRSNGFVGL